MRNVLCSPGFHNTTMELILSCISFTSVSLLFNGGQFEEFQHSKGLRQGDPISLYIFILCMELLSSFINKKCEDGYWDKVKASRNGPGFSHIFFADDLLLFAKANQKNCETFWMSWRNFALSQVKKSAKRSPKSSSLQMYQRKIMLPWFNSWESIKPKI